MCLPAKLSASLGNLGPLVLCTRVSAALTLLDPLTLRFAQVEVCATAPPPSPPALLPGRALATYPPHAHSGLVLSPCEPQVRRAGIAKILSGVAGYSCCSCDGSSSAAIVLSAWCMFGQER